MPKPPEVVEADFANAPDWVDVPSGEGHVQCEGWPGEWLHEWHIRQGLLSPKAERRRKGPKWAVNSIGFPGFARATIGPTAEASPAA